MTEDLRLATGLEWREVEGEIVALDLERSLYVAANQTAARLWRELSTGSTKSRLTASLIDACGIDAETAERDVTAFLDQLDSRGYLVRS